MSSEQETEVTACLVIIGNEILSGRTQDANLAYLGAGLNAVGIRLLEGRAFTSDEDLVMKLAMGGVTIGFVLLLAGTLHERWTEWQTDPYRDVER